LTSNRFSAEYVRALGGSDALHAQRLDALGVSQAQAMPTTAEEDWRYSRIEDLDFDQYAPAVAGRRPTGVPAEVAELVASFGDAALVVVVVNGISVGIIGESAGVTVIELAGPAPAEGSPEPGVISSVVGRPDIFSTLNEAAAPAPLLIRFAAGAVVRRPVVVVQWTDAEGIVSLPRTVVQAGTGSQGTVVEVVASTDVASLVVPVTELDVAAAANLGYSQIQVLGPRMWQIGHLASRTGRDATVVSAAVALGGIYARVRTAASLVAPGGTSRQLAVYFGSGDQMHDFRTVQDHRAPRTTSDLLYKGVVANRSHAVYTGLIRVEKGAQGTNAYQTNRNLVLHEGAHADSVPNLEIEDNDVRCSHASAVGPISDDQRFYLESRGVPTQVADRLIALGFLDEVIADLPGAPGSEVLRQAVAAKLYAAEETEASLLGAGR
jgi:Fe-S cluster assembly protein SufD